jgi:hypothetical protein
MFKFLASKSPWAVAGVATVMFAGVAVAVIIGTARVNTNEAISPQLAEPTVENIGVAVVDATTACTDAALEYQAVSSTSLFSGETLTYTEPGPLGGRHRLYLDSSLVLCVGNQETAPEVTVSVTDENVVSEELPGCPDPAEQAAGDVTCGVGEGELFGNGVLSIQLASPTAGCDQIGLWLGEGSTSTIPAFSPGQVCRYTSIWLSGSPDDATSSTDTVSFDLVFTADDGT